ncbi:hypothetical protein [Desulfoluna spongiiphila]|uniref:hypothetical protein n=1 Tax=Desulfoluna spongiiphila TaxID=419481 RepID=UPI001D00DC6F|nr:hypothetical protein [Desulfoluna spongiiphila]
MGHTLLVIFWAIIGWVFMGNYTMDVRNPKRTISQATILGVVGISGIYILVAFQSNLPKKHTEPCLSPTWCALFLGPMPTPSSWS